MLKEGTQLVITAQDMDAIIVRLVRRLELNNDQITMMRELGFKESTIADLEKRKHEIMGAIDCMLRFVSSGRWTEEV